MSAIPHWSIVLESEHGLRPRWLCSNGRFSANASLALRLVCPEVAARRVQHYMELHGWPPEVMDRFRLVPAPSLDLQPAGQRRQPVSEVQAA
jgi:hypothetical protein